MVLSIWVWNRYGTVAGLDFENYRIWVWNRYGTLSGWVRLWEIPESESETGMVLSLAGLDFEKYQNLSMKQVWCYLWSRLWELPESESETGMVPVISLG